MAASKKPFDPYHGAFFCRHCLTLEVPPRFCNRSLLLEHLASGHQIGAREAQEEHDIVCGWFDALAIREQHQQERKLRDAVAADLFAAELAELDSADSFLARCR